jgi:hypothetical protein
LEDLTSIELREIGRMLGVMTSCSNAELIEAIRLNAVHVEGLTGDQLRRICRIIRLEVSHPKAELIEAIYPYVR